jgi:GTP-binding protein HflX
MQRFLLLQIITPHYHQDIALKNMQELEQLVQTYGGLVVEKSIQHRVKPHPALYIGTGKFEWVKETVKEKKIDVVVLNHIVNSGQLFRLEKALWEVNTKIAVWDRVDLILNIFEQHASTTEAKLQIQLARTQHIGPRIYGLGGTVLSRQGAGIGTRGKGETNIEIERRNIKRIKQRIEQQLKQRAGVREQRLELRRKLGISTVALVGYTSAGKTTLFNLLTSKKKVVNPKLFTTLDTTVGKLKIRPFSPTVLISDTIGFIDELPPFLIDAFRSTLTESVEAQLLLHVIDASDENVSHKIEVVEQILQDLKVKTDPVLIFNKVDLVDERRRNYLSKIHKKRRHFFISAKTGEGMDKIKKLIGGKFLLPASKPKEEQRQINIGEV